ncbi:alpha/beta hydrolase [Candidatus Saccharibacteria bacterium]|nr:alpha/beta hydrolase [Candidatus Saccharibacteria bacterium]
MKDVKVILLHGNGGGKGSDNWLPWLKGELEKLNVKCLAPDMPDSELGRAKYWIPYLKDKLSADENTILVGHSTGAIAALKYAENSKLLGSILVGGYYTDLGDETEKKSGYFDQPWGWKAIKDNQKWAVVFASTDDPWIPIEEARFIKDRLGSEYHEFSDQGHFGYDKDKKEFPELLRVLKQKLGK